MKTLYVVRHAKSSWQYADADDMDRPLKERGIRDAYLMSEVLPQKIERPDFFMSSPANRALHTAVIFCRHFQHSFRELVINESLYDFSGDHLFRCVKALDNANTTAMLFGHNPGVNNFVNKHGSRRVENVVTCGVVGIRFDIAHWSDFNRETIGNTISIDFPVNYR